VSNARDAAVDPDEHESLGGGPARDAVSEAVQQGVGEENDAELSDAFDDVHDEVQTILRLADEREDDEALPEKSGVIIRRCGQFSITRLLKVSSTTYPWARRPPSSTRSRS